MTDDTANTSSTTHAIEAPWSIQWECYQVAAVPTPDGNIDLEATPLMCGI